MRFMILLGCLFAVFASRLCWAVDPTTLPATGDLSHGIGRFEVHNATIAQALDQLARLNDLNMAVDIFALRDAGLEPRRRLISVLSMRPSSKCSTCSPSAPAATMSWLGS
jgi:hypothetical protein